LQRGGYLSYFLSYSLPFGEGWGGVPLAEGFVGFISSQAGNSIKDYNMLDT